MSMLDRTLLGLLAALLAGPALAAETPMLGQPVTPADIKAWDISVGPDGAGLPPGKGSALQGKEIFTYKCAGCHGVDGGGTPADRLVGGQGTLASAAPVKTVGSYWPYATTLFDYIRRAMPLNDPESLSSDEIYSVAAYILNLNGIIGQKDTLNAATLPKVKMPNQVNFFTVYPGNLK
jgi:mono/diheme cytochrome c family protein